MNAKSSRPEFQALMTRLTDAQKNIQQQAQELASIAEETKRLSDASESMEVQDVKRFAVVSSGSSALASILKGLAVEIDRVR